MALPPELDGTANDAPSHPSSSPTDASNTNHSSVSNGHTASSAPGKLRICVLQSADGNGGLAGVDPPRKPEVYDTEGHYEWSHAVIHKATAVSQIRQLSRQGYDVFLNLCDGAWDEDRAGIEVVQTLEKLNLPYTGANEVFYEPAKELMKMMAYYYDIPTPKFAFIYNMKGLESQTSHMRYPMIVKHYSGYSSIGMGPDSRVEIAEQLRQQVEKFVSEYGGALVEEFIEGREFTVLVVENADDPEHPHTYLPVECNFANGDSFKHFDLKWHEYEAIQWAPIQGEPDLEAKLRQAACDAFVALRGCSYARSDFRVDAQGNVYFLEINPNPGMLYPPHEAGSGDHILRLDPGASHMAFIDHIVQLALQRHKAKQKKVQIQFHPDRGYGMYASRPIKAGELVVQHEERNHVLVTQGYAKRTFKPGSRKADWFGGYAYPVGEDVWVTWSEDPYEWNPINHSCDPNTWVDGLDLVARRDIQLGEQLTMDYATFCVENMKDFECKCGARTCRRQVTGRDYLDDAVMQPYGPHLSPYVLSQRRRQQGDGAPL